jgi:uncharacterized membrane protein YbhN (UPF0104 family)
VVDEAQRGTRSRVVRWIVIAAVLVFVFGWLLPQFIDYELVWDAITGLTIQQLLVLLALTTLRVPTEAGIYRAMLPELGWRAGSEAYLSSNVAANVMPPPAPSVIQYAYFRADGSDAQSSLTAAVGSFVFPQGGRILLPPVAFVVLLAVGGVDTEALVITGVSLAIVAVIAVLIWLIGRSETSARWVGRHLGRFVSWVMRKLEKDPVGDLGDRVVDFRDNAYAVVRERWLYGSVSVALNLGITFLILVASLRFVGVEQSDLGLAPIFAAFAVSFFAGVVIPLTGSGLGVVDVVMISALQASVSGNVDVNVIVAAVVLWRVFYSLLAFFPGALTLSRFAKTHGDLLREAGEELGGDVEVGRP